MHKLRKVCFTLNQDNYESKFYAIQCIDIYRIHNDYSNNQGYDYKSNIYAIHI